MFLLLIFFSSCCASSYGVKHEPDILTPPEMWIRSYAGYIAVILGPHLTNLTVESQIVGTGYKSVYILGQNEANLNISTNAHPGFYVIKLLQDASLLTTKYIYAVCRKQVNLNLNQSYLIQSPEFPLVYHAGIRCSWNITKVNNNTWFKIYTERHGSECLTSFKSDFKDQLCSHTETNNNTIVVTDDSLDIRFSSMTSGPPSYIYVEAIPQFSAPSNLTATAFNGSIHIGWVWSGPHHEDLTCMIEYTVHPSMNYSRIPRDCSDGSYILDTSHHRGQMFQISIFAKTSFWKSERLDYVNLTSECYNEVFISGKMEINIASDGYPFHLKPFSICQWNITTMEDSYLKVSIRDLDLCNNQDQCQTCLQIGEKVKHCSGSPEKREYLIQSNTTMISLNTSKTVGGRGFNVSVKAIDSPPSFIDNVHVESEHDFINVTWDPYHGEKIILRYIVTYSIVPDVAYHVIPVHVNNNTFYVINTRAHQGQLFAIRLSYLTEGGEGMASSVKIIRAACGYTVKLHHNQSFDITSPEVNNGYLSNVFCKWNIMTNQSLWYKFQFTKIDMENSLMCQKDYVEFPKNQKFCGNGTQSSVIIKDWKATIVFVTDDSNSGVGFSGRITALYPPSSKPRNLTSIPTQYGLLLKWRKPLLNPTYVRGYRITYRRFGQADVKEIIVSSNENMAFINTRLYPGFLFEVWMAAIGEADDSDPTESVQSLSECGEHIMIDKSTRYISPPTYPQFEHLMCQCSWTISSMHQLSVTILDIHYSPPTTNTTNSEFLVINHTKHLLKGVTKGMQFSFHESVLKIEIRTKTYGLLAAVQPIIDQNTPHPGSKSSASDSRTHDIS